MGMLIFHKARAKEPRSMEMPKVDEVQSVQEDRRTGTGRT